MLSVWWSVCRHVECKSSRVLEACTKIVKESPGAQTVCSWVIFPWGVPDKTQCEDVEVKPELQWGIPGCWDVPEI